MKGATHNLTVRTRTDVALYVLNHKRANLRNLEDSFKLTIAVIADAAMQGQQAFVIERGEMVHSPDEAKVILASQIVAPLPEEDLGDDEPLEIEAEIETDETEGLSDDLAVSDANEVDGESSDRPRRKRRRRRGREGREDTAQLAPVVAAEQSAAPDAVSEDAEETDDETEETPVEGRGETPANGERRPRRRGRRGGRRRRAEGDAAGAEDAPQPVQADDAGEFPALTTADPNRYWTTDDNTTATQADADRPSETHAAPDALKQPEPETPESQPAPDPVVTPVVTAAPSPAVKEVSADAGDRAAARRRSTVREKVSFAAPATEPPLTPPAAEPSGSAPDSTTQTAEAPRKAGWWSRRFGGG